MKVKYQTIYMTFIHEALAMQWHERIKNCLELREQRSVYCLK
jgi:hypothetical protein